MQTKEMFQISYVQVLSHSFEKNVTIDIMHAYLWWIVLNLQTHFLIIVGWSIDDDIFVTVS